MKGTVVNSFSSMSDDFGVSMYLASKVEMPNNRETVLHFFESLQKIYPSMTDFEKREDNEYMLEEDREAGSYRWISLDKKRLSSGFVNPPTADEVDVSEVNSFPFVKDVPSEGGEGVRPSKGRITIILYVLFSLCNGDEMGEHFFINRVCRHA